MHESNRSDDGYRLGIDTTNNNLCFALTRENEVLFSENIYPCSNAAEQLAYRIQDLLKKFHITVQDIKEVVSVVGPGGFSGVRIGTSFVMGLVACSAINVIAISSLQAAAYSIQNPQDDAVIIACLDARREGVYIAVYDSLYRSLALERVVPVRLLKDLLKEFENYSYYLSGHGSYIISDYLLRENLIMPAYEFPLSQEFTIKAQKNNRTHQALYFREADAKPSVKKNNLL